MRLACRTLPLADVLTQLRFACDGKPQNMRVLRQSTIDSLLAYVRLAVRDLDIDLSVEQGQFDGMMQDAFASDRWDPSPDWILVVPTLGRFAPELATMSDIAAGNLELAEGVAQRAIDLVDVLLLNTNSYILWLGFALPAFSPTALSEQVSDQPGQRRSIELVNERIARYLSNAGRGAMVSTEACIRRVGLDRFSDGRRSFQFQSFCSTVASQALAVEIAKQMRLYLGQRKKVLVLDCDGTLWDGLAGEMEPHELGLSPSAFPDAAHLALQATCQTLSHRGVLLALASKNDEERVWRVFEQRPEMLIRREDITAARINWAPKSKNIQEMAEQLNLGLDSFVFVDDNPAEICEVKRQCPQVNCLNLDEETLLKFPQIVQDSGWFEATTTTEADRTRANTYRSDEQRRIVKGSAQSLDAYLRDLKMRIRVRQNGAVDLQRAAEMIQRTNQFNLTPKRRPRQTEISQAIDNKGSCVISFGLSDCFGDLGDIGLVVVEREEDDALLSTMVLSCRAFGREVEGLMLREAALEAEKFGAQYLRVPYEPSDRNGPARDFLVNGVGLTLSPSDERDCALEGRISLKAADQLPARLDLFDIYK